MRENDWMVAGLKNPTFTNDDYKSILGMTPENTLMLSASDYKKSQFIRDKFKGLDGSFDENAFDAYYKQRLAEFSKFDESDPLINNLEYSLFDTRQRADSKIKKVNFSMQRVSNPDRITIGIAGENVVSERKQTQAELAQTQKVFDVATGKYLDYAPNDKSFVSNPFKWIGQMFEEPLVLAQWEENGTHIDPITRKEVEHQKGEYKLNDDGQYYYETLNGRSLIGKLTLSSFDIFTIDGEGINKYDFLDSDGLDKSVVGSVAKMAFTIAPMFIPYVGLAYSWALVAREMSKSLPMMYSMATSLFGNEEDSLVLNTIAAIGNKFSTGTSEYAKQNTFAFENFANLIADVATQWGQQKAIANSINKLRGNNAIIEKASKEALQAYRIGAANTINDYSLGKMSAALASRYLGVKELNWNNVEKVMASGWEKTPLGKGAIKQFVKPAEELARSRARLGADAALAYMAIVSNTDVYDQLIQSGASKRDAALVALGSTLGMFGVDKYLHLGEAFFDGLTSETTLAMRGLLKKETKDWASTLNEVTGAKITSQMASKSKPGKLIAKGIAIGKNATNKYIEGLKNHSLGFFGKALTEGIEEVNEELVTDLSKQLYEIAGNFSPNFFNRSGITDVGAWDNMLERYVMNFLGGFMGGGIFYGVDVVQNGNFTFDHSKEDLMYLISNHRTSELLTELDSWHKKGKLANNNLSALRYELTEDGLKVYLTAEPGEETQNDWVYNRIKETIVLLETILNTNGLNLGEDELYKQLVLGEDRFMALLSELLNVSYSTNYLNEFRNMAKKYYDTKKALEAARNSVDGTPTGLQLEDSQKRDQTIMNDPARLANIKKVEEEFDKINQERIEFLQGNKSLEYTEKMLFAIDPNLRALFISMTFEEWVENNKHKQLSELSESELKAYSEEYLQYKKSTLKLDLSRQFETYKRIKDKIDPFIQGIADVAKNYAEVNKELIKLFSEKSPLENYSKMLDWNTPMQGEEQDDFNFRDKIKEGESEEEFKLRRAGRQAKFKQNALEAANILLQLVNEILAKTNYLIDPVTQRYIHEKTLTRVKDIFNDIINNNTNISKAISSINTLNEILGTIKQLKLDLSNASEISKKIESILKEEETKRIKFRNMISETVNLGFADMFKQFNFADFENGKITSDNIVNFLTQLAEKIESGDEEVKNIFIANDKLEVYEALKNSENIYDALLDIHSDRNTGATLAEDTFLETYFNDELFNNNVLAIESTLNDVRNKILGNVVSITYETIPEEDIDKRVNEEISEKNDKYQHILSTIIDEIKNNSLINLFNNIDNAIVKDSITKNLLLNVSKQVLGNNEDVEKILSRLYDNLLNIKDINDFKIEDVDLNTLDQIRYILRLTLGYLYASSYNPTFDRPVGHNAVMNAFAENHKDLFPDYKPAPQLQEDVADMTISDINKYTDEMNILEAIHMSNRANKELMLQEADLKFTKTRNDFFKVNRDNLKVKIGNKKYDLLEGSENIDDSDNDVKIHQLENIFYINLHKLLKSGVSFKEILKNSRILETTTNIKEIIRLKTNKLDEHINNLSDNDKFVYLLSIAGMSANEFLQFNKTRILENVEKEEKKIAPLTVQQYATRIAMAQLRNPKIFEDALSYLQEVTGDLRPYLQHMTFIDGSAGVGKSQVVAKNTAKYSKQINPNGDIWLSAPEDTLLKTLSESVGEGEKFTIDELFEKIMNPATYAEIKSIINEKPKETNKYFSKIHILEGDFPVLKADIKFNDIKAPKLLILDEGTHASSLQYQILSKWAMLKNVSILILGDGNLNGFQSDFINNLLREFLFVIRPLKLTISLRDVNALKQDNLLSTASIMTDLKNLEKAQPDYDALIKLIKQRIKNLQFKVYNQEIINGDLITKTLTPNLVQKLDGTIAYVGDTNSDTYKTLLDNKPDTSKIITLTKKAIQGQEFDFIVVDQKWDKLDESDHEMKYLRFLQDLYTLISRGKVGSVLIDNGLTKIIRPNKEEFNKALAPNLNEAVPKFVKSEFDKLDKLNLMSQEDFEKQIIASTIITPTTEPESKPKLPEGTSSTTVPTTSDSEPTDSNELAPKEPESPIIEEEKLEAEPESEVPTLPEEVEENEVINEEEYNSNVDESVDDEEQPEPDKKEDLELINAVWGNDDDTEDLIDDEEAMDSETPLRVYSSAHLSGLEQVRWDKPRGNSENYWVNVDNLVFNKNEFDSSQLDFDKYIYLTLPTSKINLSELSSILNSKFNLVGSDFTILNTSNFTSLFSGNNDVILFKLPKSIFKDQSLESIAEVLRKDGYDSTVIPPKFIDKIYTNQNISKSKIKKDILIFAEDGIISDGKYKDDLTNQLLDLKSLILFKHTYDEAPNYLTKVFTEEEFENIKYKIVVRRRNNTDNFVGYTGLDINKIDEYNGFVFSVIALIGNVEVTLGLLANPDTYSNAEESIKKSIEYTRSKLNKNDENYDKKYLNLTDRLNGLPAHIVSYRNVIDRLTNQAIKYGDSYEIEVSPTFSALSYIRRNFLGKPITPKLLSSYLSNESDFRRSHPYLKISNPYVYVGNNFQGISEKNRGKSIVFISSDTLLNPDKLAEEYLESKAITNDEVNDAFHLQVATPRVRMIILDPKGISFRELSYLKLQKLFATELKIGGLQVIKALPFEEDYMGARMFTALWNWRANLNKFIKKYSKFKEDKGYTDEQLLKIALVSDALYRKDNDTKKYGHNDEELLQMYGSEVTQELIDDLKEFNDSLAISVRLFRLGGSLKEHGSYIRKLTNILKGNLFYGDNPEPYGIYLTPKMAIKYQALTEDLFSSILNRIVKLLDENGVEWSPDKLITTKTSDGKGYQNSLSRLARKGYSDKKITLYGGVLEDVVVDPITGEESIKQTIDNNQYVILMPSKKSYTYVPIVLVQLLKRVHVFKNMLDLEYIDNITIGNPDKGGIVISNIDDILKHEDINALNEDLSQNSLFDYMLTLAFHGTTDVLKGSIKATDAYFKKGFFADAFSGESVIETSTHQAMFKNLISNEALFEVNCEVDSPVFDIKISELNDAIDKDEAYRNKSLGNLDLQKVLPNIQLLQELNLLYEDDVEECVEMSMDEIKDFVNKKVNSRIQKLHDYVDKMGISELLNTPYSYDSDQMTVITIGDYISKKYKISDLTLLQSLIKDTGQYIVSNDVQLKLIVDNLGNLTISDMLETLTTTDENSKNSTNLESQNIETVEDNEVVKSLKAVEQWFNGLDKKLQDVLKLAPECASSFNSFYEELNNFDSAKNIQEAILSLDSDITEIEQDDIREELKKLISSLNTTITNIRNNC